MLSELHIKNIAVIQKASIVFGGGLNVFTGETGAGKTILISAIDAVLGERTSRDIIRSGEEKAQVSALFENISSKAKSTLEKMGYEIPDDSLLIFREITSNGRNTCRINGMPATVTLLKEVSEHLISVHGQRDTGQLASPEQHLRLVDNFGELSSMIEQYRVVFTKLIKAKNEYDNLDMDESQKAQRIDMLKFQIEEIEEAGFEDTEEEEALLSQKRLISGSEKVRKNLSEAVNAFIGNGDNQGLSELLSLMLTNVELASEHMDELGEVSEKLDEISYDLTDIGRDLQLKLESLDFDPEELDRIERRLDLIYKLKRKYGDSISEILGYYENSSKELNNITLSDKKREELIEEIENLKNKCSELAKALSRKRSITCKNFIQQVESQLEFLDMPNVKLSVAHNSTKLTKNGTDQLEFMIVTNLGEQPKSLGKIASGGELARIMLAIKDVLVDKDDIDTLIFDEIDTGVSGKAAGKVGRKLSEVSVSRQVLCVTHLAQVAAFANNHLYIHKKVDKNRTYTQIDNLDYDGSVKELARITSGEVITEAALETSRELIKRAKEPYVK